VIDCQRLKPGREVISYITGYLGKPPSLNVLHDLELLDNWREALNYGRFLIKAGRWPAVEKPAPKERATHVTVQKLADCMLAARRGDPAALALLCLCREDRGENGSPTEPLGRAFRRHAASEDAAAVALLRSG
jgi:hypothetical protein